MVDSRTKDDGIGLSRSGRLDFRFGEDAMGLMEGSNTGIVVITPDQ